MSPCLACVTVIPSAERRRVTTFLYSSIILGFCNRLSQIMSKRTCASLMNDCKSNWITCQIICLARSLHVFSWNLPGDLFTSLSETFYADELNAKLNQVFIWIKKVTAETNSGYFAMSQPPCTGCTANVTRDAGVCLRGGKIKLTGDSTQSWPIYHLSRTQCTDCLFVSTVSHGYLCAVEARV